MSQTVLVADDSQTIRRVVQMALKASKYEVVGVGSAREAVQAAKQQPSVILLDYYMPDGSGYDVCRAIKQNSATSAIPVIMLGGSYKKFDASQARDSGAAEVVMKPFKTDELVGAIESAIKNAAAAPSSQPQARHASQGRQQPPARQQPQRGQRKSRPAAPSPPSVGSSASRTPVPESQPRIPVGSGAQSRAPSGSQPQIPGSGSHSGISAQSSKSGARKRKPTPPPGSGSGASAPAMSRGEIEDMIRTEVKDAVRRELPGMLRNIMGEVFQQKVLPKLLKHSEDKIQQSIDQNLDQQITRRVRMELERLLSEE